MKEGRTLLYSNRRRLLFQTILPFVFLGALSLVGCKSGSGPAGEVSGKVTFEGKPVTEGTVTFQSDAGTGDEGTLNAEGAYSLKRPLPTGDYKVFILPPVVKSVDPKTRRTVSDLKPMPDIPEKYRSQATSDLKAKIEPGKNVHNFEMKR